MGSMVLYTNPTFYYPYYRNYLEGSLYAYITYLTYTHLGPSCNPHVLTEDSPKRQQMIEVVLYPRLDNFSSGFADRHQHWTQLEVSLPMIYQFDLLLLLVKLHLAVMACVHITIEFTNFIFGS